MAKWKQEADKLGITTDPSPDTQEPIREAARAPANGDGAQQPRSGSGLSENVGPANEGQAAKGPTDPSPDTQEPIREAAGASANGDGAHQARSGSGLPDGFKNVFVNAAAAIKNAVVRS